MAVRTRVITDTLRYADGSAAINQTVYFRLEGAPGATSAEFVLPLEISAATNGIGMFSASVWCNADGAPGSIWRCDVPVTNEQIRFFLTYDTGASLTLRSLRALGVSPTTVSDAAWLNEKEAVVEYSLYRPLMVVNPTYAPTVGSKPQTVPANVFGVETCTWGDAFTFEDIMDTTNTLKGWCWYNNQLYLTPAPTAQDTPFLIIWRAFHTPNEFTRSHPTIPTQDRTVLGWLIEARELEGQESPLEVGLSSYTIGSTKVAWSGRGGGGLSASGRGARLRTMAINALQQQIGVWG